MEEEILDKIINITPNCSGVGLKLELETKARGRGFSVGALVAGIYKFAVHNQGLYKSDVKDPREKKGDHIGARVSGNTKDGLGTWAKKRNSPRGFLCCYILEYTLENPEVLKKAIETIEI